MDSAVATIGHNLDFIKRRIMTAHIRVTKSGAEWVEGTLEIAAALREAREMVPADVSFSGWLKQHNLAYYNKNDRAALICFAADIELARTVLTESDSRSYQHIWHKNKGRFLQVRKPTDAPRSPTNRKRRAANLKGRAGLYRTMKLGEEAMSRIKGTSLDSAPEMDELVILNRGAPDGGLTPVVARLIEAAASGEAVSAIAEGVAMGGGRRHSAVALQLMTAWKRRMAAPWQLASEEQKAELVRQLISELDREQRLKLAQQSWGHDNKGGE
jgi:hypothetical protein